MTYQDFLAAKLARVNETGVVLPIVTAAAPFIHCDCTDEHEVTL